MNKHVETITRAALIAAVVCVSTFALRVPVPSVSGAYIHPGDAFILLSGMLLGPAVGAAACGIGSALSDLLAGYTVYALPTLFIKAGMGTLAAVLLARRRTALWLLLPEALMVAGYFLFEALAFGTPAAFASVPFNLIQAAGGALIALVLRPVLNRSLKVVKQTP